MDLQRIQGHRVPFSLTTFKRTFLGEINKKIHFSEYFFQRPHCMIRTPITACWSRHDRNQYFGFKGHLKYSPYPTFLPSAFQHKSISRHLAIPHHPLPLLATFFKHHFLFFVMYHFFTIAV